MITIQKNDYIFSVDVEKTKNIIKNIPFEIALAAVISMHRLKENFPSRKHS